MNRYTKPAYDRITTPAQRRKRLKQSYEVKRVTPISNLIFVDDVMCVPADFALIVARLHRDRKIIHTSPFIK